VTDTICSIPAADTPCFRICISAERVGSRPERRMPAYLRICVPQFDRDIPDEFVFKSDGHDTRYGLDHCGFPVRDMADRT
jgi:hypothetical protein